MATDNSDILRAFFKCIKNMTTNFDDSTLDSFIAPFQEILCDESGNIDPSKFAPNDSYINVLRAYGIILSLKNADATYDQLRQYHEKLNVQEAQKQIKPKTKQKVVIPDNWGGLIHGNNNKQTKFK